MANRGPKYGDEKEEDATDAARKYARKQRVSFPCGSVVKSSPATQQLQEIWVQSLGQEYPLEEGMATHSSILAWRIPWTEVAGGYGPWDHRVGHD